MPKPLIAVTMGDPAGVGPEVCLQLLANEAVREFATPVIFGDARLLSRCARQAGLPAPKRIISEIEWAEKFSSVDEPAVLDIFGFDAEGFTPGTVSAKTGAAGYRYVEKSIQALLREVQSESLVVALKGANPDLRELVFKNMSTRAAETLREDLESRGPVRVSEVEAEQKEILKTVRRLVEEGQIQLPGGGDDQFI
jgi:hypothetical protein